MFHLCHGDSLEDLCLRVFHYGFRIFQISAFRFEISDLISQIFTTQVINLLSNKTRRNKRNSPAATSTKRKLGSYPASSITTLEIWRIFWTRFLTSPSTSRANVVARWILSRTLPTAGFSADVSRRG